MYDIYVWYMMFWALLGILSSRMCYIPVFHMVDGDRKYIYVTSHPNTSVEAQR